MGEPLKSQSRHLRPLPLQAHRAAGQALRAARRLRSSSHARQAFGITSSEEPIKVRLLFEPKLAVYISERQWHPRQVLKRRRDGRIELRIETTGRKELVRWVLSWMPDVRVIAPKTLRDRIAIKLEEGLRRKPGNEKMPNQTLHTNREQARGR